MPDKPRCTNSVSEEVGALTLCLSHPKAVALGIASYNAPKDEENRTLAGVYRVIARALRGLEARGGRQVPKPSHMTGRHVPVGERFASFSIPCLHRIPNPFPAVQRHLGDTR